MEPRATARHQQESTDVGSVFSFRSEAFKVFFFEISAHMQEYKVPMSLRRRISSRYKQYQAKSFRLVHFYEFSEFTQERYSTFLGSNTHPHVCFMTIPFSVAQANSVSGATLLRMAKFQTCPGKCCCLQIGVRNGSNF